MKKLIMSPCLLLISLQAFAISTGAVAQFPTVYVDPANHLAWSHDLRLGVTNGCYSNFGDRIPGYDESKCTSEIVNGSVQIKPEDSDAAKVCLAVGGRLPTKLEFESLIRNFEHDETSSGPSLTKRGNYQMNAIFKDMHFEDNMNVLGTLYSTFFTSTLEPTVGTGRGYVYVFRSRPDVRSIALDYRNTYNSVRCVATP